MIITKKQLETVLNNIIPSDAFYMIAEELKEQNLINKTDSEFYQIIDLIWNKLSELEEKQIIEILAEYAHDSWSGWMNYLFNLSKYNLSRI